MYVKQLYGSVAPIRGLEFQLGGLYINHGENTEVTSYDDDGYVMGERVTLRAPSRVYFDELSFTRAGLASIDMPGLRLNSDAPCSGLPGGSESWPGRQCNR